MIIFLPPRLYEANRVLNLKEAPNTLPWVSMCNRVIVNKFDPFRIKNICPTIEQVVTGTTRQFYSFEEMCERRALHLAQLPGKIYLMWSGGIDSTSVLVSFLKYWPKQDLERLHLLVSRHTFYEFPGFYGLVSDKFQGRIHSSEECIEDYCTQGYVITGEHGDQIFGSDIALKAVKFFGDQVLSEPWPKYIPKLYNKMFGEDIAIKFWPHYVETLDASLYEIYTVFDWLWWFNFTNKWQQVKYRILLDQRWEDSLNTFPKILHFYDTLDWQRWSMEQENKAPHNLEYYKYAAKKFVVDYTGMIEYMGKVKVPSLLNLLNVPLYDGLDMNFEPLSFQECLEYQRCL
jgi:hypothetical protein